METVTLYLLPAPLILGGLDCYFIKELDGEIRKKRRVWKEKKKKTQDDGEGKEALVSYFTHLNLLETPQVREWKERAVKKAL